MSADVTGEKGLLRGRVLAVPVDVLSTPRDGDVMTDRWWAVRDGRALFWQGRGNRRGWSPQCNHDRRIADSLVESIHEGASAEFIPVAYVGRWDEEWGHVLSPALIESAADSGSNQQAAPDGS